VAEIPSRGYPRLQLSPLSLLLADPGRRLTKPVTTPMNSSLSLDLRLRFLETLLASPSTSSSPTSAPPLSLARRVSLINSLLKQSLETGGGGEAVRRFVHNCLSQSPSPRQPAR
jgi:hypothetical protein